MYYIQQEGSPFAARVKTLSEFASRKTSEDTGEYRVYKSKSAYHEGFDFTAYDHIDGKLKKSKAQPVAVLNRWLSS
jgi:hypothetical protein